MNSQAHDESTVRSLYSRMLEGWNSRSGLAMAELFTEDGEVIGFDGTHFSGRDVIASTLQEIFDHHQTANYVGKVRSITFLAPGVALLRAVAGMIPPGQSGIKPDLNAVQTLVATKAGGEWRVVLYQNTPAQFHGRPELVRSLTEELQKLL